VINKIYKTNLESCLYEELIDFIKIRGIINDMNAGELLWREFYKDKLTIMKFVKRIMCNIELIFLIIKQFPLSVIEIGTGTGALSAFISWFLPTVIAIDNDKEVLKRAKLNCKKFGRKVNLVVADAFNLPFKNNTTAICFSQGFFEHFKDEEINKLISEQLRVCRKFILFNVPSDRYPVKPFGNERLMHPLEWGKIIQSNSLKKRFVSKIRYSKIDIEAIKYFFVKRKWQGFFEIIGVIKKQFERDK